MTTIYIDILVCLNVIVNYFLLLASGKFLSRPYKRWRILLGAFLGGLYSLYILLPQLTQWFTILVELAMAATITLTAFGRKGILKTCSCFFAMSFLFAGSMFLLWKTAAPKNLIINNGVVYFQISPLLLIGTTVASYVLVRLFQRITGRAVPEELFCMVQVVHRGKRAVFRAKVDTGNQLREPFSHLPVIVVKETAVSHLAPESGEELNFRMIPFHSLDQEGVLPGFLPDRIMIEHGKDHFECRGYLGICKPRQLPPDFDGLMNSELLLSTGMKGKEHEKVKSRVSKNEGDFFS